MSYIENVRVYNLIKYRPIFVSILFRFFFTKPEMESIEITGKEVKKRKF